MSGEVERVRMVRLSAESDVLIRQGATLLEDAMHTTTMPFGRGGEIVFVRTVDVGVIRADQSSAALSQIIQERMRHIVGEVVHADDPSAAEHPAVYFSDPTEPYVQLAVRIARGQDVSAWFWPLAVRTWDPRSPQDQALVGIVHDLLGMPTRILGVAGLFRRLDEHKALDVLLASLRPADGARLMTLSGLSIPDVPSSERPPTFDSMSVVEPVGRDSMFSVDRSSRESSTNEADDAVRSLDQRALAFAGWSRTLREWSARWGVGDARSFWVSAVCLAEAQPAAIMDPGLSRRALRAALAIGRAPLSKRPRELHDRDVSPPVPSPAERVLAERTPHSPVGKKAGVLFDETTHGLSPSESVAAAVPETGQRATPATTDHAGLLFVLAVLDRLQIGRALVDCPQLGRWNIPARMLRTLCDRLEVAEDDPVLDALSPTDVPTEEPIEPFTLTSPCRDLCLREPWCVFGVGGSKLLTDRSQRLALALWTEEPPNELADRLRTMPPLYKGMWLGGDPAELIVNSWLTASRRWCRWNLGMGLIGLVRRKGMVIPSRTHVDVFFDIDDADIRLRKAGLDVDPGWVSWFGKVVQFHYVEEGELAHGP